METREQKEIVSLEPILAWADELRAWYLEHFVILVARGARSRATPPVEWRLAPSPPSHQYSLHLTRPEHFLHATAFLMNTAMRSVQVRDAGHPDGVSVPVTPLELPSRQELLADEEKKTAQDEREVAQRPVEDGWELAPARFIIPFSLYGHLLLVARGENPTTCYEVRWSTHRPGTYVLRRRQTGKNCPEVLSPYMAAEAFRVEPLPRTVRIIHADRPQGELLEVRPLVKPIQPQTPQGT